MISLGVPATNQEKAIINLTRQTRAAEPWLRWDDLVFSRPKIKTWVSSHDPDHTARAATVGERWACSRSLTVAARDQCANIERVQ